MRGHAGRHRRGRATLIAFTLVVGALALPGPAPAYTAASNYSATDYATGFPFASCCSWGPIGVAFDRSDNLYVSDFADGHIYRFQPGGGVTGVHTRLTADPISGGIKGLAVTRDGRLYLARGTANDVVEIDPATGRVKRTVVKGVQCAVGLVADPISGDLFVSQSTCKGEILRISDFADGPGKATRYAATGCCADGLAFAPDGTLYAASGGTVLEIGGTASSTPGLTRSIASVPGADGVAIGVADPGQAPFIVVNRTNGQVTRLDFSSFPPAQAPILTGGTRGDFVAVDSRGCLYVTQTDSILRVTSKDRECNLAPSTPGAEGVPPPPGIVVDTISNIPRSRKGRKCLAAERLVVRLRQRGRVRLKTIRVYVKGRYRKTVRNRRVSAPIEILRVPRGRFTVKLVARTTRGKRLTAKRRYRNCRRGSVVRR